MKYRIIYEQNGNGSGHYEAEYQTVGVFGFTKWIPIVEGAHMFCWPKRFDNIQTAETAVRIYIRSMLKTRTIVQQGCISEQPL